MGLPTITTNRVSTHTPAIAGLGAKTPFMTRTAEGHSRPFKTPFMASISQEAGHYKVILLGCTGFLWADTFADAMALAYSLTYWQAG